MRGWSGLGIPLLRLDYWCGKMPNKPGRQCPGKGPRRGACQNVIGSGERVCAECLPYDTPWVNKNADKRKIRGRKLQSERARLFAWQPLCAECERQGRVRIATVRDHIIPLAEGGEDTAANSQGLCDECHKIKTAAEAARGKKR